MRNQFLLFLILLFGSCKSRQLKSFKPVTLNKIKYDASINENHTNFFRSHNDWIMKGIDSISLNNKSVKLDTNCNDSDMLNFTLVFDTKASIIKNKRFINYEVALKPLHLSIYENKKYVAFGMGSVNASDIDSFAFVKKNYYIGFNTYFNNSFFTNLIPWEFYLKSPKSQKNAISFSFDNLTFQKNKFSKEQKEYFSRIINNSFVKYTDKNNRTVKTLQKFRNQFFLNFYNNKKRLFNVKTDYSVALVFSEAINKDSIYLDIKYFSKKNKEMNLLIPDILKTHYVFNKKYFDLGNHIDVNLAINYIIKSFIGNHNFIRYGEF